MTFPIILAGNLIADYAHEGSRKIGTVRRAGGNRLLSETLARLSRNETRHFSADTIHLYLERYEGSLVEFIRETIAGFRIPLADLIRETGGGYSRPASSSASSAPAG